MAGRPRQHDPGDAGRPRRDPVGTGSDRRTGGASIAESFAALRAAGGDAWDKVADVEEYIGRKEPAPPAASTIAAKARALAERIASVLDAKEIPSNHPDLVDIRRRKAAILDESPETSICHLSDRARLDWLTARLVEYAAETIAGFARSVRVAEPSAPATPLSRDDLGRIGYEAWRQQAIKAFGGDYATWKELPVPWREANAVAVDAVLAVVAAESPVPAAVQVDNDTGIVHLFASESDRIAWFASRTAEPGRYGERQRYETYDEIRWHPASKADGEGGTS